MTHNIIYSSGAQTFLRRLAIFVAFIFLGMATSCTKEVGGDQGPDAGEVGKTDYGITFEIADNNQPSATRAPQAGETHEIAAFPRENKITNLSAVLFAKNEAGDYVFYRTYKLKAATGRHLIDVERAGTFKAYLIANIDEGNNFLATLNESSTVENLQDAIVAQAVDEKIGGEKADFFIMTSNVVNVTTVKYEVQNISVALKRLAARFDFYNKIDGFDIKRVTFKDRVTNSRLVNTQVNDAELSKEAKVYTFANPGYSVGEIYSYESVEPTQSFFVEGVYTYSIGGEELSTEMEFAIELKDKEGGAIGVARNYIYNVVITERGGEVEPGEPNWFIVDIQVLDWNEGETIIFDDFYARRLSIPKIESYRMVEGEPEAEPRGTYTDVRNGDLIELDTYATSIKIDTDNMFKTLSIDEALYGDLEWSVELLTSNVYVGYTPNKIEYPYGDDAKKETMANGVVVSERAFIDFGEFDEDGAVLDDEKQVFRYLRVTVISKTSNQKIRFYVEQALSNQY